MFKDFDWKNGKLNTEQLAYLKQYAEEQIESYLSSGDTDTKGAEYHLSEAYKIAGLKPPIKFEWLDSPKAFSVWDSVGDSVWDSVWDSVRDSVGASVWDSVWAWYDANDCSFYKTFNDFQQKNSLEHYCLFTEKVTGFYLTADTAYLVKKPTILERDNGQLHSTEGKAIEWPDGFGSHALHGVRFENDEVKLWRKIVSGKLTGKEYLNIKNDEQRMVALKMMREADPQWFFKQTKAELVDKSERGNELYIVRGMYPDFPEALYARYFCPSTGREYITGVDPQIDRKADAAVAWICQMTPEEYARLEVES